MLWGISCLVWEMWESHTRASLHLIYLIIIIFITLWKFIKNSLKLNKTSNEKASLDRNNRSGTWNCWALQILEIWSSKMEKQLLPRIWWTWAGLKTPSLPSGRKLRPVTDKNETFYFVSLTVSLKLILSPSNPPLELLSFHRSLV